MNTARVRVGAASLLLATILVPAASAQFAGMILVAEESFTYPDGDLNGQGGWVSGSTSVDVVSGQGFVPASQTAERAYTVPALPAEFTFNANGQPTNGIYYYTLQIVSPANTRTRGNFNVFGGSTADIPNRQNGWGVRLDDGGSSGTDITLRVLTPATDGTGRPVAFTKPFADAATLTIYGQLNFNSALDQYSNTIWVNPTDTTSFAQIAATAAGTATISDTFVALMGGAGANQAAAFFSTRTFSGSSMTYDNVALYAAPVPEPSTVAAILGGVTLGAVALRRRRSAG